MIVLRLSTFVPAKLTLSDIRLRDPGYIRQQLCLQPLTNQTIKALMVISSIYLYIIFFVTMNGMKVK